MKTAVDSPAILIFSSEWDLHARAVSWALNGKNILSKILDVSRFPSCTTLSISPICSVDAAIEYEAPGNDQAHLSIANVVTVWCRRMMVAPNILDYSAVHPADLNNVIADSTAFINGMWHFIYESLGTDATWVNPLKNIGCGGSKATQLRVAHSIGFCVPDTIMGNNPVLIREFCARHGGSIVMKPFLQKGWNEGGVTQMQMTARVTMDQLLDDLPIKLCPAIYQNMIEKKFELRVVVLGEKIIAAKLNSQAHDHSRLDWRLDAYKEVMSIEPYFLSDADNDKIKEFMGKIGLVMGSLDFIVDVDDKLVFLEVNEQGQFLFLDRQCPGLNILQETCAFISSRVNVDMNFTWPSYADYVLSDDYAMLMAEHKEYYSKEIREVRYVL